MVGLHISGWLAGNLNELLLLRRLQIRHASGSFKVLVLVARGELQTLHSLLLISWITKDLQVSLDLEPVTIVSIARNVMDIGSLPALTLRQ